MAPPSGMTATTAGAAPAPPVSPGCAGETLAEREERRLAEDAVPVRLPARQPQAAPNVPDRQPRSPCRPGRPPPPLRPRPLPPCPQRRPRTHKELQLRPRPAAPRPPARCWHGVLAPRGPRAPQRELPQPRRRAGRVPSTPPTPSPATPTPAPEKAVRTQGRLPRGEVAARPPPGAQAYAAGHHGGPDPPHPP